MLPLPAYLLGFSTSSSGMSVWPRGSSRDALRAGSGEAGRLQ